MISPETIRTRNEPQPTELIVSDGRPQTTFVGLAKTETMLKDFDRLRKAIRAWRPEEAEQAFDRCERWISCIDPSAGERERTK